jgi:hypothetical protein
VYEVHGRALEDVPPAGLNMYFPMRSALDDTALDAYNDLAFSAPVKQWVNRYVEMARGGVVTAPQLSAPFVEGSEVVASVSNSHYASGFATLQNASGIVYALKPTDGSNGVANQLRAQTNAGWFSVEGVPVLMLPDESQFGQGRGRYTIPVAYYRDNGLGSTNLTLGLLGVAYTQDATGVERYEIDSFYETENGYNPIAKRLLPLPLVVKLIPIGYNVALDRWVPVTGASFPVPDLLAHEFRWLVTKGALPIAPNSLRLGVNDFLSQQHFSAVLP